MILSAIKLLIGLVVLVLVGVYIDPFQDPQVGVIIGSVGLLFFVWGLSYFVLYICGIKRSDKKLTYISNFSYKTSLLIALYMLSNIILLVLEAWSVTNGVIILILFAALFWFLFFKPSSERYTSLDMITKDGIHTQ
ncbi:MAG TPA: hypothetical protein PLW93_04940 [Candidatus Absconditabacterales bacterium]|nr:hypothetical protein [Candidatus Absconditabacterales bacterium]HNG97589.1 hypothetical protein [Candidatus Absconditabacterales bacterium]